MRISYVVFFISLTAFSQTPPQIQVIPNPKSLEDFDHQYKGCLENSECDQVMGLQLTRWRELIDKVKENKIPDSQKAQYIELFRNKYGLPVEFYTTEKSQQGYKPLLFNSHCKNHNPKAPETKTVKGIAFIKSMNKDKAVVWRDQTQIEVPVGELLTPQPVVVYQEKETKTYYLPIEDQPLFIKNNELYVIKEEDGLFYVLKIAENGDWKIENLDFTKLSTWEDKRSEVSCPKDPNKLAPKAFAVEFCKTVWDEDLKKSVIVKMHQGCVL